MTGKTRSGVIGDDCLNRGTILGSEIPGKCEVPRVSGGVEGTEAGRRTGLLSSTGHTNIGAPMLCSVGLRRGSVLVRRVRKGVIGSIVGRSLTFEVNRRVTGLRSTSVVRNSVASSGVVLRSSGLIFVSFNLKECSGVSRSGTISLLILGGSLRDVSCGLTLGCFSYMLRKCNGRGVIGGVSSVRSHKECARWFLSWLCGVGWVVFGAVVAFVAKGRRGIGRTRGVFGSCSVGLRRVSLNCRRPRKALRRMTVSNTGCTYHGLSGPIVIRSTNLFVGTLGKFPKACSRCIRSALKGRKVLGLLTSASSHCTRFESIVKCYTPGSRPGVFLNGISKRVTIRREKSLKFTFSPVFCIPDLSGAFNRLAASRGGRFSREGGSLRRFVG